MKKSIFVLGIMGAISTSMIAKDFNYDLSIGLSQLNIVNGDDGANLSLGYGVTRQLDSKVLLGVAIGLEHANAGDDNIVGISSDLKIGYHLLKSVNIYALGGYRIQNFYETSSYGFGYGAGVEYLFEKNIAIALEHKTYAMKSKNRVDYDFSTLGFKLEYIF